MEIIKCSKDANYEDIRNNLHKTENTLSLRVSEKGLDLLFSISERSEDWILINIDIADFLTALGKSIKKSIER